MEALTLSEITEGVMSGSACVVYSFNRSAQSGVGKYVVHSLSVNGIQKNLPTLGVFTDSSSQAILCKIDFVVSESTLHYLNVMEHVFGDKGIKENAPQSLLRNVRPLMLFQKKIKIIIFKGPQI